MATTYTLQAAKIAASLAGSRDPVRPDELSGRVRVAYFEKMAASEAVADIIALTALPVGSKVLAIVFCCTDMSDAGAATLAIGDVDDPDRLVLATDVGTAALPYAALPLRTPDAITDPTLATPTAQTVGFGYRFPTSKIIYATVAAQALNATGLMAGAIFYTVD